MKPLVSLGFTYLRNRCCLLRTRAGPINRLVVAVKDVGVEVCAIWPHDCPDLGIDLDLGKDLVIVGDLFEHRAPEEGSQVNGSFGPVGE